MENSLVNLGKDLGNILYFITVQQIFEKVSISKAKLLLNLNSDAVSDLFEIEPGHHFQKCSFTLTKQMCNILDCLPEMQVSVFEDLAALVYIAGYLTVKSKNKDLEDSHCYYGKYGSFAADLNRIGLHIPGDSVCQ